MYGLGEMRRTGASRRRPSGRRQGRPERPVTPGRVGSARRASSRISAVTGSAVTADDTRHTKPICSQRDRKTTGLACQLAIVTTVTSASGAANSPSSMRADHARPGTASRRAAAARAMPATSCSDDAPQDQTQPSGSRSRRRMPAVPRREARGERRERQRARERCAQAGAQATGPLAIARTKLQSALCPGFAHSSVIAFSRASGVSHRFLAKIGHAAARSKLRRLLADTQAVGYLLEAESRYVVPEQGPAALGRERPQGGAQLDSGRVGLGARAYRQANVLDVYSRVRPAARGPPLHQPDVARDSQCPRQQRILGVVTYDARGAICRNVSCSRSFTRLRVEQLAAQEPADRRRQQRVQLVERLQAARLIARPSGRAAAPRPAIRVVTSGSSTDLPLPSGSYQDTFGDGGKLTPHATSSRTPPGADCSSRCSPPALPRCRRPSSARRRRLRRRRCVKMADTERAFAQARRGHHRPAGVHRLLRRRSRSASSPIRCPRASRCASARRRHSLQASSCSGSRGSATCRRAAISATSPGRPSTSMPGKPNTYTCYFSVWKRQPDGEYRVILDVGVPTPAEDAIRARLRALGSSLLAGRGASPASKRRRACWRSTRRSARRSRSRARVRRSAS